MGSGVAVGGGGGGPRKNGAVGEKAGWGGGVPGGSGPGWGGPGEGGLGGGQNFALFFFLSRPRRPSGAAGASQDVQRTPNLCVLHSFWKKKKNAQTTDTSQRKNLKKASKKLKKGRERKKRAKFWMVRRRGVRSRGSGGGWSGGGWSSGGWSSGGGSSGGRVQRFMFFGTKKKQNKKKMKSK